MSLLDTQHKSPSITLGKYGPLCFKRAVKLDGKHLSSHKWVQGITGGGKSKLLASLFLQQFHQGIGVGLLDPAGDLANGILRDLIDSGYCAQPEAKRRLLYSAFARTDGWLAFAILSHPPVTYTLA